MQTAATPLPAAGSEAAQAGAAESDFGARIARLSRLEGIVEQMNQRLTNLDARMDSEFLWIIGIQITTLLTLGTLILFKR